MYMDGDKGIARYFFESTIIENPPRSVRGYGFIDFNIGEGYFVDSGSHLYEWHHNVYKITKEDLVKLTGTPRMPKEEDWGKLALLFLTRA